MSQQAEGVLTIGELLDQLVRSQVVVSKDGYSCDGTDLYAFPNSDDLPDTNLNDTVHTEATAIDISTVTSAAIKIKNNNGTNGDTIQALADTNKPLDTFGLRISETGGFVYDAPTVQSTGFIGQESKIIDAKFTIDPAFVTRSNFQEKITTADFETVALRDVSTTVRISEIFNNIPVASKFINPTFTNFIHEQFVRDSVGNFYFLNKFTSPDSIDKYDTNFNFITSFNVTGLATGIAIDSNDTLFIGDGSSNPDRIQTFSTLGVAGIFWEVTTINTTIFGLGVNSSDEVYVTYDNGAATAIRRFTNTGTILNTDLSIAQDNSRGTSTVFDSLGNVYVLTGSDGGTTFVTSLNADLSVTRFTRTIGSNFDFGSLAVKNNILYTTLDTSKNLVLFDTDNQELGTINQSTMNVLGSLYVKDNDLFIQGSSSNTNEVLKYTLSNATLNVDVLTSTDGNVFTSQNSQVLTDGVTSTVSSGSVSMQFARITLSELSSNNFKGVYQIFDISDGTLPVIIRSDLITNNEPIHMIDGDLSTFNLVISENLGSRLETIVDFRSLKSYDFNANVKTKIKSGTPATLGFILEGTNDLFNFTSISSGTLVDNTFTNIASVSQEFRYARIIIDNTGTIQYTLEQSLFEVWDKQIHNGLDFSTVEFGGSGTDGGGVNQADPLSFEISDGATKLHRPRYFLLEASKFLSVEVTALRTGQVIQTDRAMTWQRNFSG